MDESTVLGVDDLVDALLKPKYDKFASRAYWNELAEYLIAELGRMSRRDRELFDRQVEGISGVLLPIEKYLEAPRALVEVYRMTDRTAVAEVKQQMRALQAKYLRDFLVVVDPAFETTTTTFGTLVERGFDASMESTVDDPW